MKELLSYEESCLLGMLKEALGGTEKKATRQWEECAPDWGRISEISGKHAVTSLLYDVLDVSRTICAEEKERMMSGCHQAVLQSYRLLFLTKYITRLLEQRKIPVVVLKGVSTAAFYPVPELRKSGDIDILILKKDVSSACKVMREAGMRMDEEQRANHHIAFTTAEGIAIELHTMFAEPFDNEAVNRYMTDRIGECFRRCIREEIMGIELPVLDRSYHAWQMILHMLQHFLRSGFGLKLLCDWTMIWRQPWTEEEKEKLQELAAQSGIKGFIETVTGVCVKYLGLERELVPFVPVRDEMADEFLREILDAEEFGKSDTDRMVALRGTGVMDFVREFHHQMRLTYPKAGEVALLWPILWVMMFVGFVHRNRTLRRVSTWRIIKKAAGRGRLTAQMHLFER